MDMLYGHITVLFFSSWQFRVTSLPFADHLPAEDPDHCYILRPDAKAAPPTRTVACPGFTDCGRGHGRGKMTPQMLVVQVQTVLCQFFLGSEFAG